MAAILLLDLGLASSLLGLVTLLRPLPFLGLRSRRRGAAVLAVGILLVATAACLPASERSATSPESRLDDLVSRWQFDERHETRVHASPQRVESAIRSVTAAEIRFFRLFTWLRSPRLPGRRAPETILSAGADRPILEVALGSGFWLLADEPGELVIGTLVIVPPELARLPADELERRRAEFTPTRFAVLEEPGYAKAAMNFRWNDDGGGWCRLSTETRVYATDAGARRRFAAYWRVIYPGSATLRRMWLRAIRERAES